VVKDILEDIKLLLKQFRNKIIFLYMFLLGIYIVFSRKNFGDHNDFILFDIKNNTQKQAAK
jgi:hypothetical protein